MASIQAERTPNPNSLKFTAPNDRFVRDGIVAISTADETEHHELGERLFSLTGVDDIFITPDFVTVSKTPSTDWSDVKPKIEAVLTEYLEEG